MMAASTSTDVACSGEQLMMRMMELERKWKPHLEMAPNCPRCASSNTKFCYYNNYSLSQPRYFCKSCRRYWTKGGSLRNVPVGGGCRRTRRSRSSRSAPTNPLLPPPPPPPPPLDAADSSNSDIDMAVVFAKFLNPADGVSNSNSNSVSSTPDSGQIEGIAFPPAGDLAEAPPYQFTDLFRSQGFLEADQSQESMIHALGLQTLLTDEMERLEAAMWSTAAVPGSGAWQVQPQEQGFGVENNWACLYDEGSLDIFSTP